MDLFWESKQEMIHGMNLKFYSGMHHGMNHEFIQLSISQIILKRFMDLFLEFCFVFSTV